jgi:hypothetical protein
MPEVSGDGSSSTKSSKIFDIKLPATCDPPGEGNPPKEAVWIVCWQADAFYNI